MPESDNPLAFEKEVVWLENPATFEYVREDTSSIRDDKKLLGEYSNGAARRPVGYTTLRDDAPQSALRRVFFVKCYDRHNEPGGLYARDKPFEGVDPLTVVPGKRGEHNDRAWGSVLEKKEGEEKNG